MPRGQTSMGINVEAMRDVRTASGGSSIMDRRQSPVNPGHQLKRRPSPVTAEFNVRELALRYFREYFLFPVLV